MGTYAVIIHVNSEITGYLEQDPINLIRKTGMEWQIYAFQPGTTTLIGIAPSSQSRPRPSQKYAWHSLHRQSPETDASSHRWKSLMLKDLPTCATPVG